MEYWTIIGRDPILFSCHVENVLRNAGLSRSLWSFNVIIYHHTKLKDNGATDILIEICKTNDINYHLHEENPSEPFIKRLYACWNKMYELCKEDLILRGGSDQAWSPNSFANILEAYESCQYSDVILQAQTVEHHGPSRHLIRDFGDTFDNFNEEAFVSFCNEITHDELLTAKECIDMWGKPTKTIDNRYRTEGCSWLQNKKLWEKYGPMPDYVMPGGITGDVWLNRQYQDAGIPDFMVPNAITYHMIRGESKCEY